MGQKTDIPEIIQEAKVQGSVYRRQLPKLFIVVAIVFLVIVGVLIGVFTIRNMAKAECKVFWVSFHINGTDDVIKERVIVDDQEVYIRKPGEVGVVYDYEKRQVAMQIDSLQDSTVNCQCMLYDFDSASIDSLEETIKALNQTYVYQEVSYVRKLKLSYSGQEATVTTLSKRSREMCLGCKIYSMSSDMAKDVPKRGKRCTTTTTTTTTCSGGTCTSTTTTTTTNCNRQ